MDVKDLMIGDWVQNPLGAKGWVKNIRSFPQYRIDIAYSADGESYAVLEEKDVNPIPLTVEILKKNFDKRPECYGIFDDYFDFMVREYSDGIFIANYHHCEMSLPDTQIADIAFVHELQHALRLCGIEKEIQL